MAVNPHRAAALGELGAVHFLDDLAGRVPLNHAIWRAAEAGALARWPWHRPILDIGCGDGSFAGMLLPGGVDAGIDVRERQLVRARARGSHRFTIRADASKLPFRDCAFRSILSNCVFEHVPNVNAAFLELGRVLEPGGTLAFTVPTPHFDDFLFYPRLLEWIGGKRAARWYAGAINDHFRHYHIDPPDAWVARCEAAGLQVVERCFLMPRTAVRVWDGLMPAAILQTLSRRLGRRRFNLERGLLTVFRSRLQPLMARQASEGANVAFLAVRN